MPFHKQIKECQQKNSWLKIESLPKNVSAKYYCLTLYYHLTTPEGIRISKKLYIHTYVQHTKPVVIWYKIRLRKIVRIYVHIQCTFVF